MESLFARFLSGNSKPSENNELVNGDVLIPEALKHDNDKENMPALRKSSRPRKKSGSFVKNTASKRPRKKIGHLNSNSRNTYWEKSNMSKRPRQKTGSFVPDVTKKRDSILSNNSGFQTFREKTLPKTPDSGRNSKRRSMVNRLEGYYPNFKVAMSPEIINSPRITRNSVKNSSKSKKKPFTTIEQNKKVGTPQTGTNRSKGANEDIEFVEDTLSSISDGVRTMSSSGAKKRKSFIMSQGKRRSLDSMYNSSKTDVEMTQASLSFDQCMDDEESVANTSMKSEVLSSNTDQSPELSTKSTPRTDFSTNRQSIPSSSHSRNIFKEDFEKEISKDINNDLLCNPLTGYEINAKSSVDYLDDGKERVVNPKLNRNPTPMRRRSSRRRWKPLRYWRGERVVYKKNLAKDIQIKGALKTMHISSPRDPRLKRKTSTAIALHKRKTKRTSYKLPDYLNIERASEGVVEYVDSDTDERKEVVFRDKIYNKKNWQRMPISSIDGAKEVLKEYPPLTLSKSEVKKAWLDILPETSKEAISIGKMKIPPRGLKVMEDSGDTVTYFTIEGCQKNALVFRLRDADHIVDEEMSITVPPNTIYGFENMSNKECSIIHYSIEQFEEGRSGA